MWRKGIASCLLFKHILICTVKTHGCLLNVHALHYSNLLFLGIAKLTAPSTSSIPRPSLALCFSRTHLLRIHSAASVISHIYNHHCENARSTPGKCSISILIGVILPSLHRRASNPLLSDRITMMVWLQCSCM